MGSTRLPGKVLADLAGKVTLQRVVERTMAAGFDDVVVATTTKTEDDRIWTLADSLGARVFRGSEHDVLSRYVGAAREAKADIVVRVTADCPLLDPTVSHEVAQTLTQGRWDFASNAVVRSYPQGLDTEACWVDVLERLNRLATSPAAREHVFWHVYREEPNLYRIRTLKDVDDNSMVRWTLDTEEDLVRIRRIFERYPEPLPWRHLLSLTEGSALH